MRRRPARLKWGVLTLLAAAALIPVLNRTALAPRGLAWRADVKRCCIVSLTLAVLALLVWTGVLMWRQSSKTPHRCAVVISIGLLCLLAGGIGRFMLRIGVPYERVIQRGGQRVVEESPPLDSGSNYYTCHGPLLRGTELLEESFYLEID